MDEFTRAATWDDLKTLVKALNDEGADYLLIGAFALALHGHARATTDIDILVPASRAAGAAVCSALMVLPDAAARDVDPTWFEEGENIRVNDAITVDVLFNANGLSYEMLRQHATTMDLDGVPVRTVDLEGLLLTKQTMREKDVPDRLLLERAIAALRDSGKRE